MIIAESTVSLQSTHLKTTVNRKAESFRAWIDGAPEEGATDEKANASPSSPPMNRASFQSIVDRVRLSAESLSLAHGKVPEEKLRYSNMPNDAALMKKLKACTKEQCNTATAAPTQTADAVIGDSRLNLMKQLVEALSGKKVQLFDPSEIDAERAAEETADFSDAHQSKAAVDATSSDTQPQRTGWGVAYDYSNTTIEHEQTSFTAAGVVKTRDGREINFTSGLQMERDRIEVTSFRLRAGDAQLVDPLVLNFNGNAADLTDEKLNFDLNSDGIDESISFVAGGSGFLVYDRNQDGIVNNGSELFGPSTGNGFTELAAHDDDNNGWIDEADAIYNDLRIWQGSPAAGTLTDLRSNNVGAIYLGSAATPFELRNPDGSLLGQTASTGIYLSESGMVGAVQQVNLAV